MNSVLTLVLAFAATACLVGWLRSAQTPTEDELQRAHRAFTSTRYFSGLDGLRGISVLAVIWCHVTGPNGLELLNHGNKGVDLFFAISGFLVTTLLLREHQRTGQVSLRNFYIRRTLRIFPLYYAVLALYCVLVYVMLSGTPKADEFWKNLPAFATYTANWFVTLENGADHGVTFYFAWSLATEEQFYLVWPPLLLLVMGAFRQAWAPAAVALLLLALQLAASSAGWSGMLGVVIRSLAPAILAGVVLAIVLHHKAYFKHIYALLGNRFAAPAVALSTLTLLQVEAPGIWVQVGMAVLVATICIRETTPLHGALTCKPLVFIGTISYGMYLMHMLAINLVRKVVGQHDSLLVFVGAVVVVTVMAYLSFRFFESPILRLKDRLASAPNAPRAPFVGSVTPLDKPTDHHVTH